MSDRKPPGGKAPRIDTTALLSRVDIVEVIGKRVELKKDGAEFSACCPFHNEKTPSFKVSPAKQIFKCFGCGETGDAIKFLQEYDQLSFVDACRELGADVPASPMPESNVAPPDAGGTSQPAPRSEKSPASKPSPAAGSAESAGGGDGEAQGEKVSPWVPVMPVPDDAPEPPAAHRFRGAYSHRWAYRDAEGRVLGYTCRFEKSTGGKEILPLTFCRHSETGKTRWDWLSFPEPRPLYGLDRLAARPDAPVLVVEGEKCADAAQAELPTLVVVSWPGGGKAVKKADWSPLAGRNCLAWADCDAKRERLTKAERDACADDLARAAAELAKPLLPPEKQPGVQAMAAIAERVLELGGAWSDVAIPAPGDKADGWDIADAIAEGLKGEDLAEFIRSGLAPRAPAAESISTATEAGAGEEEKGPYIPKLIWSKNGLRPCMQNAYQILAHHPDWAGVVAYNEFSLTVEKLKPPPYDGGALGEWETTDDSRTAIWLAHLNPDWEFTPSSSVAAEAIETLARARTYHPVREYFAGLKWDGEKRLRHWLTTFLGVKNSPYSQRVGTWWLMGAVKRILQPGAKFDNCLVLSGDQGKKKSATFEVLASQAWFGDTDLDLNNKDSMSALRGKLIYEIAELGALARSEEKRQKSFLTRRVDEYRPVYGRREIKAPRQVVFGGTTNEHEWNKDPTGGRRFWPVDCTVAEIDIEGLRSIRDQLWAEALAYVQAGERYWPTQEEQKKYFDPEQLKVEQPDGFVDGLHDWVYLQVAPFSLYTACVDGLKLDAGKLTRDTQTRVGIALRKLGCGRIEKRNGMTRYWYQPPVKNEASSTSGKPAQHDQEKVDVGF